MSSSICQVWFSKWVLSLTSFHLVAHNANTDMSQSDYFYLTSLAYLVCPHSAQKHLMKLLIIVTK